MDTWALGETDPAPSEYEQDNTQALSDKAYSMARAMEAQDAHGRNRNHTRSTYRPGPTPGLRSCLRQPAAKPRKTFQFSQPAPVARAVTGYTSNIRRKPVPVRAMSSMATPAPAPRQRLLRAATNHQFGDFLGADELARQEKDDMRERRASPHPFEALATKGLHSAKKYGLKAVKLAEQKLSERKRYVFTSFYAFFGVFRDEMGVFCLVISIKSDTFSISCFLID